MSATRSGPGLAMGAAFSIEAMLSEAERATGLSDWGDAGFRRPLDLLIADLNTEAQLSEPGVRRARRRLHDVLCSRLQLIGDRKRFPGIGGEQIRQPIVVIGLPRSGTTFFHNLLARDPHNRAPLTWEIMFPSPPPERSTHDRDPRIQRAREAMEFEGFMAPELQAIHPFEAQRPEECNFIWETSLWSVNFMAWWHVPNYTRALYSHDFRSVYREHRAFLQQLQHRYRADRWVLKTPAHMQWLDALFAIYPDALMVQCHRDPAKVLASISKNLAVWRRTFSDFVPRGDFGLLEAQAKGLERVAEFRAQPQFKDRFVDAHYLDVQADPMAVVRAVYRHFGLSLSADSEAVMTHWLETDRAEHSKGPRHVYALEDYDLDLAKVDSVFGEYIKRSGVQLER
jgi:Sulfotransferase family